MSPGTPFNKVRISSVTTNLIAIDNLRADGVLIALVSQPLGMLQIAGSAGGTDSYTIANRGSASASVTLTQSGNVFTQTPPSFSLPAGGTQKVTLAGTVQGPGSFAGTSIVSAAGAAQIRVPVTLLSAVPPSGTVRALPSSNRSRCCRSSARRPPARRPRS